MKIADKKSLIPPSSYSIKVGSEGRFYKLLYDVERLHENRNFREN